ncbi:UNVERIFIED_ORG: hypothetical protein M2348_000810 [Sphingomonas sp. R1F5B]
MIQPRQFPADRRKRRAFILRTGELVAVLRQQLGECFLLSGDHLAKARHLLAEGAKAVAQASVDLFGQFRLCRVDRFGVQRMLAHQRFIALVMGSQRGVQALRQLVQLPGERDQGGRIDSRG